SLMAQMGTPQLGELGPVDPPGWGFGLGFAVLRDAAASGWAGLGIHGVPRVSTPPDQPTNRS
ncbi:hypothetical protein, partial [Stenotrophomonas sp. G106K1]|uniref:hypothetical protein n=1 Tax=Stenotrophomonas sp. G106K1 TaxID=3134792 RepID=UPI0030F44C58